MANDSVCKKCSLSIDLKADLFTVCEGFCANFYHADCVGLSENDVLILSAHSLNIVWLCDGCMQRFRRVRGSVDNRESTRSVSADVTVDSNTNKTIHDEVNELKDAVAGILDTLTKFVPASVDHPVVHSTPVSSFSLQDGTNAYGSIANNDESLPQQSAVDDGNFSLLLSNIDASVVECDIHRMVTQALGVGTPYPEDIAVVKLVSKWKSRKAVDYISFKVVLANRWKSKAMNPATWPSGIKFREFINRNNYAWKPLF